jgi:hypothetical protein
LLRAGYQQKQTVNTVVCSFLVTFTSRVVDIVGHNKMTNWVAAKVHARVQNILLTFKTRDYRTM